MTADQAMKTIGADRLMRPPATVMRLERLGSMFPSPLSFMRVLVRRMAAETWRFERTVCDLDANGYGRTVWRIAMPDGVVSFVAFTNALEPDMRTDRVIAERWDAAFVLVDGEVDEADLDRLEANVPLQEAGRVSARELVLSRANKSVRLFQHVTERLAEGRQPDIEKLASVGYLMRTTAVYGNGKFGLGDYPVAQRKAAFDGPFRAEMLAVFMIREFQFDLVNHIARARGAGKAAELAPEACAALGIGNSTGLGMAPYIVRHPVLFHHWIAGRETALARVRAVERATAEKQARFRALLQRAAAHLGQWNVDDERQQTRIVALRGEVAGLLDDCPLADRLPWDGLMHRLEAGTSLECQELMASLLIELHPDLVDDLAEEMGISAQVPIDGTMRLSALKALIERDYDWALAIDFDEPAARHYFWYYSEGKEEPRLGQRFSEPGAEKEMRLGAGAYVAGLHRALSAPDAGGLDETVAAFLLRCPQWRLAVRRVLTTAAYPYAEIRDNTIGADLLAIDMLRCKLSFFGATKFDPRSDKWTRITMYQGAPRVAELCRADADDWWLPVLDIAEGAS